jgi:hypothetical protein
MEPQDSLPHLQVPANCPYHNSDQSIPWPPSHFLKIHLKIILPPPRVFQVISFPQVSPPKSCVHLCSPPYVIHALPISFFSIWSSENMFSLTEFITEHNVFRYITCTCSTTRLSCRDYIRQHPVGLNDKYCGLLGYPSDRKLEGPTDSLNRWWESNHSSSVVQHVTSAHMDWAASGPQNTPKCYN